MLTALPFGRTIPVHTLFPGDVVIDFPNDKHDQP
jgi:type VI secretion system secreted protein VgrG